MHTWLLYFIPFLLVMLLYFRHRDRRDRRHREAMKEAEEAGLREPVSLHPIIDTDLCIGSSSCVKVCPENALGVIDGKAYLVNGAHCIGHGACLAACPVEAISLVFGTEKRGVDIPIVKPNFETNVPGIFIAGELGGMGLIRKAAEQGRQAIDSIRPLKTDAPDQLDVMIVGAGPAGIAAGLGAVQHKLKYRLIEQEDSLGGCVYHYPRNKITMTAPVELPLVGKVKMTEVKKEDLLEFWQSVVKKTGLKVKYRERMESIEKSGEGFIVKTSRRSYRTRTVLLTIGRRGTPRKLEVPGEEQAKVVYRLIDAEQYRGQHILVVGGGDSALEAAIALSEQPDTRVTLSYRGSAFARVKGKNRELLTAAQEADRVRVMLGSTVDNILPDKVLLSHNGAPVELDNHAVIVCAGGVLPTPLLQQIGVLFETKRGTA
jgi:thioredoxin reductase/NAD-dependent dihydropyrimidine dehydrogenase PreA subunit